MKSKKKKIHMYMSCPNYLFIYSCGLMVVNLPSPS